MLQTIAPAPLPDTNDAHLSLDDFYLDIFGQQGTPIYTQICFCYSIPDNSPAAYMRINEILQAGLERLSASFPWIAGQIVHEPGEGGSGVYKIKYLDDIPKVVVKDLRTDPTAPTMAQLRESSFPFRLLDERVICPRDTLILPFQETLNVCLIQTTFINGGLLFTFLGHHAAMDGIGQNQIMNLLNKACRCEPFTDEELEIGNIPRKDIVPLFPESHQLGTELNNQLYSVPGGPPPPPPPMSPGGNGKHRSPSLHWAYYIFSGESLKQLKAAATSSLANGYISTDDALTALVWQSVVRARLQRLRPSERVHLARAIDIRRYLRMPATYPGCGTNMSFHDSIALHLAGHDLGTIATNLRASIDPKTSKLGNLTKSYATHLSRTSDKNSINLTASLDLSKDIMLSSWSKMNCYDLDFGFGLGNPEAVRRPQFKPVESLFYFMPKKQDGEVAVALCLRDEDFEALNSDEEFIEYGKLAE
ncbi:hypothetical protein H072_3974 [Dactylellina haptotyla CBS 200.50]|uniref:Trichothecene 3-O-acetyltransferase-like N-terminal domain-containing protein n=1 Tax=Dactylellina haptotyla (strain CBS 200.50) TaxID=1284197 RepID=S8ALY2_DACHA|nr:hypothetical protein H072_3974 [Dactylellina haptotyla CBS 200.50]